ncbi:hypothetical protein [Saccharothrix deserti]|uniref:hypothetical protein n=1 Tax=Saccharothrix deserti TaxID=2593674 RepID=UPI00192E59C2|nr:hypothetical protein [Saccharothrix deserti]
MTCRTVPKRDRRPDENEDSVAVDLVSGRFAVSDGASTAARSAVWSALLVDAFAGGEDPLAPDVLDGLRREWWSKVFDPGLPWFAVEKLQRGSAATFVGLRIGGGAYQVTAVGDTCLFHVSDDELVLVGPVDDHRDFSRYPDLVSTHQPLAPAAVWSGGGAYRAGDVFLIATDAVAKHVLRERVPGVLRVCETVGGDLEFVRFVASGRQSGLDNDDTTVCVVHT